MRTPVLSLTLALGILSTGYGGEPRVRIEMSIAKSPESESTGHRTLFRKKEEVRVKDGADLAFLAAPGKAFKSSSFKEFIAPTSFDPPEYPGTAETINREDGSILLVSLESKTESMVIDGKPQHFSSFPVTPGHPNAFEMFDIGWEIEGTPRLSGDGLVILEAEVRHHDARPATAHYGEGTGPIVAKAISPFGKEVEIILTENKAQMASTTVTRTPLLLRARPGVTYPIKVMLGDKAVAATIRCSLVEAKASHR